MIQKLSGPRGSTAVAPFRPPSDDESSTLSWGSWRDGRHYRLQVIQQPIRARMCGFGDKDRRPLAPATVARLIVHDEQDNPVDETEIDYSFFVVTADLWSADGAHERNLVLHPTPHDRHAHSHPPPSSSTSSAHPKRRRTAAAVDDDPDPPPSTRIKLDDTSDDFGPPLSLSIPTLPSLPSLALSHPYEHHHNAHRTAPPPLSPSLSLSAVSASAFAPSPFVVPAWAYLDDADTRWPPDPPPSSAAVLQDEDSPFRTWSADPAYEPLGPLTRPPSPPRAIELSEAPAPVLPSSSSHPPHHSSSSRHPDSRASTTTGSSADTLYAPAPTSGGARGGGGGGGGGGRKAIPGHAYTRTLVGPLAASACRLFDQHRNPAVFFLFQDLSVRTEGAFRLRLRLMNIGAPPTTPDGLPGVATRPSAILAQTFTDTFDVYSAKRFPGVPDTTALSIAFGNQGQKLPLRNRHGSRKDGRRRRRGDDYDSDGDSDG